MKLDLSTDVGYDEPDTFSPTSTKFSRERRRHFFPTESTSTKETHLMDEREEVGSSSEENQEERYVFHINPEAHRPITRAKNKIKLSFKIMDNPKLKYMVINIDDTPVKEDPPKPRKVKASRPTKPSKVKVYKE